MTENMNQENLTQEIENQENVVAELKVGDTVSGEVTKVSEKMVTVYVEGLKGIIPISELSSLHVEKAEDIVKEGEVLTLKVIKHEDGDLVLSKKAVDAEAAWKELVAKFESGEVFDVLVRDSVNGGLVVDLGVRGFIPASLVEKHFVDDFQDYVGKELAVKIVELDAENNRLILSHRAVIEMELAKQKADTVSSLQEGAIVEGTVQRLADFGVFVDIGGVDGLVHISQLAHDRVENPADVVEEGQTVKVKILSVNPETNRISLSMKDAQPSPWETVDETIHVGDELTGTVKRLVAFGAFVEIAPHIEGLVHVSQIAHKHVKNPNEVLSVGQEVKVKVLEINKEERRISLSIKATQEEEVEVKQEEINKYQPKEENSGFNLGELLGDKLKNLRK